ncbi:MAG: primosomal protein N' [Peptococcaceae bacterium]|nr:primosomal protein N' [Peptococcaceae bacterium]
MGNYAEVLVDVANRRLDQSYSYLIPENMDLKVGMTVIVSLKNRKVQGLVVRISENASGMDEGKLKPIESILEDQYLIPPELIELASWLAETTICSIAQALHTVWPFLKGKMEQWVIPLADLNDNDVKVLELLDPDTYRVLVVLNRSRRKELPLSILLKRANVKQILIEEMIRQGWIKKEFKFSKAGQLNSKPEKENRSFLLPHPSGGEAQPFQFGKDLSLSFAQNKAAESIWEEYQKRNGKTVLLHGITGSGKTEVYRETVTKVIQSGGDAIILVPEISLTSQISKVFLEFFGEWVGIIHSGISPGEKLELWEQILAGKKRIIIGARSAVFAPLPHLSLIILDEEHDNAYKQDENPKYHARDVARKRMMQRQGLVVLGSATPSLEAYAASQRGKVDLISLSERYNQRSLPAVQIVDMKQELAGGNKTMFSFLLREKLGERIERGEQSILFLNRRGYSTFVFCRECGFVARCPQCDVSLTFHSQKQELCCHYCNYRQEVFHRCPDCGSRFIRFFGQGTQKVEEEVAALFPGIEVLRLDTDTTAGSHKHIEILNRFRNERIPVLVGTQMLAKGLDFPNVTLVGVISADQLLNMPDFRSRERAFQLLTQVAGRAGRGEKTGDVIIQTYSPQDRAVIRAARQDYPAFFWEEIAYRKQLGYPPFSHIIRIMVYHEKEERVIRASHELTDWIKRSMSKEETEKYQILGPAPAVLTRLKNEFRWQVSVKGKNPEEIRKIVYDGVQAFYRDSASSGMKISIDVNPLSQ